MVNLSMVVPDGDRSISTLRDGYDPRVLRTIRAKSITAAIWQRQLPGRLTQWLDRHKPAELLELGLVVRPKFLFDELTQAAEWAGIVAGEERRMLLSDISTLATDFARIVRSPSIDVRLALVAEQDLEHEALSKKGPRLLCVYRVAAVRQFRESAMKSADLEVTHGRTSVPLSAGSVVVLKPKAATTSGKSTIVRAAPSARELAGARLFYMLTVFP